MGNQQATATYDTVHAPLPASVWTETEQPLPLQLTQSGEIGYGNEYFGVSELPPEPAPSHSLQTETVAPGQTYITLASLGAAAAALGKKLFKSTELTSLDTLALAAEEEALQAVAAAKHASAFNKCTRNIAEAIATFLPDILMLQEIRENSNAQWGALQAALRHFVPRLNNLYGFTATSNMGRAGLMTLYNKRKFTPIQVVQGDFLNDHISSTTGRPYLITVFQEQLIVINVHFPQFSQLDKVPPSQRSRTPLMRQLQRELAALPQTTDPRYQVVLAGDFNLVGAGTLSDVALELESVQTLVPNKHFFMPPAAFPTVGQGQSFDHILSTIAPVPSALYETMDETMQAKFGQFTSDHLPVMATIPWLTKGARADWTDNDEAAELRKHPLPRPPRLSEIPEDALCLIHKTALDPTNFQELRRSGSGAVFVTLVTKSNLDILYDYGATLNYKYTLILPLNLLASPNYFINLADQYGGFDPVTTYFPWQLPEVVAKIREQREVYKRMGEASENVVCFNEVVFGDPIKLRTAGVDFKVFSMDYRTSRKLLQQQLGELRNLLSQRYIVDPRVMPPQSTKPFVTFGPSVKRGPAGAYMFEQAEKLPRAQTRLWTRSSYSALGQGLVDKISTYDKHTGLYEDPKVGGLGFAAHTLEHINQNYKNRNKQRLSELHDLIDYEQSLAQRNMRSQYDSVVRRALQRSEVPILRAGSTDLRVMTYNVCWEALEGVQSSNLDKRMCAANSTDAATARAEAQAVADAALARARAARDAANSANLG